MSAADELDDIIPVADPAEITDLVPRHTSQLIRPQDVLQLMRDALLQQNGPEVIRTLADLQRQAEDREAARQYADAMRAFQSECPPILNKRPVMNKGGQGIRYKYASYYDVRLAIQPFLDKHGFSFDMSEDMEADRVRLKVTVYHSAGHSVSKEYVAPIDKGSFATQPFGTVSQCQRHLLKLAFGLVFAGEDEVDGAVDVEPIAQVQGVEIRALIKQSGASEEAILKLADAETIEQIPQRKYATVLNTLRSRLKNVPSAKPGSPAPQQRPQPTGKTISEPQAKRFHAICHSRARAIGDESISGSTIARAILDAACLVHTADMERRDYERLCAAAEAWEVPV